MPSFIYGFPGDALGYLYFIWRWRESILPVEGYLPSVFSPSQPQQILLSFFLYTPSLWLAPVAAYNLVTLLTLVANFFSMFLVSRKLMSRPASFLAAVVFASSAYVQWHATQNIELAMVFWLPPFFLFLVRFLKDDSYRNLVFLSLFSSLAFLNSFYLGFFALILASSHLVLSVLLTLTKKDLRKTLKKSLNLFLFGLIFFFLTLPATVPFFKNFDRAESSPAAATSAFGRNTLSDLIAFGARPWDYLLPSIYHPIFGSPVKIFYEFLRKNYSYQFWSTFLPERANYLTFSTLVLALYALIRAWRRKDSGGGQDQAVVYGLAFSALLMFLVSLPAVVSWKGVNFYLPSYYLFKVLPMFRVYARAGIFVLTAAAFLAGFGLDFLVNRIKKDRIEVKVFGWVGKARPSLLLTVLLSSLILFENLNFPPFTLMDLSKTPQVYRWLKEQPGDLTIVEYPKDNSGHDLGGGCPVWLSPAVARDYNPAYEYFYQTVHGKKVLDTRNLTKEERIVLADLSRETFDLLRSHEVDYLLFHTRDPLVGIHPFPYPQENPLDDCWQRRVTILPKEIFSGFRKVVQFDDGAVFRLQ